MASIDPETGAVIPITGGWPVDPQEDLPIRRERVWVDGCFDFSHHGHAGAMLQARRRGEELYVGVHSDEEIRKNKGPTVMSLTERVAAVEACRWSTVAVPHAPYVTSLPWISHYGCHYVVHGDDVTSDGDGNDCYRFVKAAGRFLTVKRTPGISTTDLVGRMLLCTKTHFVKSLTKLLVQNEEMQRMKEYATDESGLNPGPDVWLWTPPSRAYEENPDGQSGEFSPLVSGKKPLVGQRVVYVDGGFDLFSSGHIEFLKSVLKSEDNEANMRGWYEEPAITERMRKEGFDYPPAYITVGVHDDEVINRWKGLNYPIMNIFERGLCVLQCKYVNSMVFGAPFIPSKSYLNALPTSMPDAIYHGPTQFMPLTYDPYTVPKQLGIFRQIDEHPFSYVNAEEIVQRILKSREDYEERQRQKHEKALREEAFSAKEMKSTKQEKEVCSSDI